MTDEGDSRPTPDPTVLTTDAIRSAKEHTDREIGHLKELMEKGMADLGRLMMTMFADNKRAVEAALTSQKDVTSKTETNFAERVKQADVTTAEIAKGLGDRITALEARVSKTEAAVGS